MSGRTLFPEILLPPLTATGAARRATGAQRRRPRAGDRTQNHRHVARMVEDLDDDTLGLAPVVPCRTNSLLSASSSKIRSREPAALRPGQVIGSRVERRLKKMAYARP